MLRKRSLFPFLVLSLRQGRKFYAKLIEIRFVLGRVIVEHAFAGETSMVSIEVDLRLIGFREQR
jgi:hypothetical protein